MAIFLSDKIEFKGKCVARVKGVVRNDKKVNSWHNHKCVCNTEVQIHQTKMDKIKKRNRQQSEILALFSTTDRQLNKQKSKYRSPPDYHRIYFFSQVYLQTKCWAMNQVLINLKGLEKCRICSLVKMGLK